MVARKGQPSLGNDPGKRGGWEHRAIHGINKGSYTRGYFQAGVSFFAAMRRASKVRGISANAYLRRSVAAFAAHDLGIPMSDILGDSPHVGWQDKRGEVGGKKNVWQKEFDDGEGFGSWEVK